MERKEQADINQKNKILYGAAVHKKQGGCGRCKNCTCGQEDRGSQQTSPKFFLTKGDER